MTLCPVCKHDGAYIGANEVECANISCKYFSKRQYADMLAARSADNIEETLDSEDPVDHPLFLWCSHHYDFGD